jgi:hypothetical protein
MSHPLNLKRKISNVSRSTQKRARRLSREGAPELEMAVGQGKVSSKDAEALLTKSKGEQRELVAQGPEAAKAAAAAVRAEQATAKDALATAMAGRPLAPGDGEAVLDQAAVERGIDRHAPSRTPEPPTAFEQEMATGAGSAAG